MKRKVSREKKLPAFSIDAGDMAALWMRLLELFDGQADAYSELEITTPSETLKLSNTNELQDIETLQNKFTKFSLWISKGDRHIHLKSSSLLTSRPVVSASAETEAWCAGAIETVSSFLLSKKLWYSWFVNAPIGWFLFFFANTPILLSTFLPSDYKFPRMVLLTWLLTTITFAFIYVFKDKILPSSILAISSNESFFRRHAAELSLLMAGASLVLTVLGFFIKG